MPKEPTKIERSSKRVHTSGGFQIEILYPGLNLGTGDSGLGAIGRIDHARLMPGTLVSMHHHKDDEILTYVHAGTMRHRDSVGHSEEISSARLMRMNAGHTFQHEEETPRDGQQLLCLQIFMRPRKGDLEPQVQFHDFSSAHSPNEWRLLAGPREAPMLLRADAWIHDTRLDAGQTLALQPQRYRLDNNSTEIDTARLLYVFDGRAEAAGAQLVAGESLLLGSGDYEVQATEKSDLVLFTTSLASRVFKGGMFSGNILT